MNNVVEADHGKVKQLIRPVRGFETLKAAYATIMGFELMRALRKGQTSLFNLPQDIRGEARIVERAFGVGPSALAEAMAVFGERSTPNLLNVCDRATSRAPLILPDCCRRAS